MGDQSGGGDVSSDAGKGGGGGGGATGDGTAAGNNSPGKGGGGDTTASSPTDGYSPDAGGGYNPTSPYAPTDTPTAGLPPEIFPGPGSPTGSDPLAGPGPVGGGTGLPGAGGGTNTPWADIPGLSGTDFDYIPGVSSPITSGGVSSVGPTDITGPSLDQAFGPAQGPTLDDIVGVSSNSGMTGADPTPGPSASAIAAPTGVSGTPELAAPAATTDVTRDTNAGGTSQTRAVQAPGLLDSLGLNRSNLGPIAAGAGLLNTMVNGRGDTASADALRTLAAEARTRSADVATRSAGQQQTGGEVSAAGQRQIARGEGMTDEGRALQQWVQTGTLPQGYESQVQSGIQAAIQRVVSNHAARGQPTDPTRNSVLAEEIRQIEARAPEMRMQLAQSLANTGNSIVSAGNTTASTGGSLVTTGTNTANSLVDAGLRNAGLSANIYRALLTHENALQQRRGAAIANFAAALNGGQRRAA